MSRNHLDQETSPYLLLHKDNPVHWRPWGPEALAEAEASNKPILLSIGYTACHWCHVMNEESFSDQATADIINENYIPIKVDREERPDLDLLYQTSASAMGVQAGWPLTAFLTSHGNLFFAGTYYPINEQPGLAKSFKWVLNEINRLYRDDQDSVTQAITNISQRLTDLWHKSLRGPISLETLDDVSLRIGQRYDIFYGGMTGSPKFPNFIHIQMLVRAYLRSGRWAFNQLAQSTLIQICQGGIYDHLGGGIARYSTDERWIVPHFEKMLYDNALFIETLTLAWQQDRSPLFKLRIEETIAWLGREMIVETAFASSIDADSEGEEGKYYLWSEPEIDAVLSGTFSQNFKLAYNVTREGNYKGHTVLHRLGPFANFGASSADEALFEKQRSILLEARNKRVRPIRDDKVLADWNAMMIAALANAGAVFENSQWIVMAIRAFEFLEKTVCDGERLYHSWHRGKRGSEGFAEDYAHMARAALALFETTNDQQYLDRAKSWVRHLNEFHWDNLNGGYFQTSDDAEPLSNRIRSAFDQFTPPANGIMPTVLAQLWLATNDKAYRDRCNAVVEAFSGEVNRAYISMPSFVNSIEYVATNVQVVIVGPVANPRTQNLISAVRGRPLPNKWLTIVPDGRALPTTHPAYGKTMVNGLPTAYLCLGISCSTPTSNPNELSQALNLPRKTVAPNANQSQFLEQVAGRA